MGNTAYMHVTGANELSAALRGISDEVRAFVLQEGLTEAAQPVLVAAKRFAKRSERTGALRESLTVKVKNYPADGKAVALVGADKNYYRKGKKVSKISASVLGADRPSNYAHLVEFGHHAVAPKKGKTIRKKTATVTGWVPPKPFLRPALMTTQSEQAAGFFKGIERGFTKAVTKATKNARAA